MHERSQIQDRRWSNVIDRTNNENEFKCGKNCKLCGTIIRSNKHYLLCVKQHVCVCGIQFPSNKDELKNHKKICDYYTQWRKFVNLQNGIKGYEKVLQRGELQQWKEKISKAVSNSINSDENEIKRRKELSKITITKWAKSEEGRKKSSETAIKTSSRKDILQKRSKVLKNWRENNKEEFHELCIKLSNYFVSFPQSCLFNSCFEIDNGFKQNQQIFNENFTSKTKRRQIDILHKEKKIIIEFDGPTHFRKFRKNQDLEKIKLKDEQLNDIMFSLGYCVIRVTYDDFNHTKGGFFSEKIINFIKKIVSNPMPGIYRLGKEYGENEYKCQE